jgi:hypothetical protein
MSKEIIYSNKEYQEKYNSSLDKYFLEYKEIEEIDFIIDEIKKYNVCLILVNFPIDKIFNTFWRVEYGINLKSFTISQETYDFIFADENDEYYYKIYNDIVETLRTSGTKIDIEKKIKQARLMFVKIISFLETKKKELEIQTPQTIIEPESLDLSKTSAVEKIIYLNELGIIDFLRAKPEFMGSTNLMATILSAITDEKATTLQTSLNRLINNDTDDKNHPYKALGTVNKIKQTFINKNIKPKTS